MADAWKVTVKGPNGEDTIEIPDAQVRFFTEENSGSPTAAVLWLAYTDVWMRGNDDAD